jgi:fatty acid desaturase
VAIGTNIVWIAAAIALAHFTGYRFYVLSALVIGARQRAIASLLHEAAHGTLFKSRALNQTIGRFFCGWTILQSFGAYRTSHVLNHHPKIGRISHDPDFQYMSETGVYEAQTRLRFVARFLIAPFLGLLTPRYMMFLLRDRLWYALTRRGERIEVMAAVALHVVVLLVLLHVGSTIGLLLFWWLPFFIVYPVIGWFSELAEHYPLMERTGDKIYFSRNRYAGRLEQFLIGMHGDNYHLTHHLLPGVPHWHLHAATLILREDPEFRKWDDTWGGIFSSRGKRRVSLVAYVLNDRAFEPSTVTFGLTPTREH